MSVRDFIFGTIALGMVLCLGGCAAKSDRQIYERLQGHRTEFSMLQQSEKVLFKHGEGDTTVVLVTYLPRESKEGELFILSAYPGDGVVLNRMRLADMAPGKIEKISREELPDALRRRTPGWFSSYRILFPHVSGKKLTLTLQDATTGELRQLLFVKGPKYLVTKPKF